MKILFVSSEVFPYAKTGGLADVSYALPKALYAMYHDVRVVMPRYRQSKDVEAVLSPAIHNLQLTISDNQYQCSIHQSHLDGKVPIYFVEHDAFFDRPELYELPSGEYHDNALRFILFCRAVIEGLKQIDFRPDIIHCHDWQTALIPVYLKTIYRDDPFYRSTACLFTIHNIAYQGLFWHFDMHLIGLGWEYFTPETLEFYGKICLLKGGILFADLITTVSPTYAREIQTVEAGSGLEGVLRKRSEFIAGVVNGIDLDLWSPETDSYLSRNYSFQDLSGKRDCKKALLREVDLEPDVQRPLIGMISRLESSKGLDILLEAADRILKLKLCFIILGKGRPKYHDELTRLAEKYPDKIKVFLRFDDPLAHRIEAGCDMFLLPSLSEPSGLNHLYSMRYGTVPLVRKTGGLADTVINVEPANKQGTGFVFVKYSSQSLIRCLKRALSAYQQPDVWHSIMIRGMKQDFSWERSARQYLELYSKAKKVKYGTQ